MLDKNKVKLGIAPIGWTNDDMPDLGAENTFEQCVSEMALAGFTGCEVGNKYPKDPAVLKKYWTSAVCRSATHGSHPSLSASPTKKSKRTLSST